MIVSSPSYNVLSVQSYKPLAPDPKTDSGKQVVSDLEEQVKKKDQELRRIGNTDRTEITHGNDRGLWKRITCPGQCIQCSKDQFDASGI